LQTLTINQEDTAFLQYTGGTTGLSKGAVLTHRNMLANMLQLMEWSKHRIKQGEEVMVTPLPMYHIFSLTVNCLVFIALRAKNVLITNPRDIKKFIKTLRRHPFTAISGVTTLYNALVNHEDFKRVDFSRLRFAIAGGTAMYQRVATRWQQLTNCCLIEGYGLTEASPVVCANPFHLQQTDSSIGLPLPGTEVVIRDDDNQDVAVGEAGELCVKGPQVMQSYWNNPEETQQVFTADGWLKTGDIGYMDEAGFFYIVDRKKDMINVSGFNVYPNEVENVINQHPKVDEAAVVGVADERSGEAVKAFIVKKSADLTYEELRSHCKQALTRYKIPRQVEFVEELPKTNVGKILRRELREQENVRKK
jgi:long-chain acyl-CoA synthetase